MMSKKLYIESLGCAKNQVDSEVLISRLSLDGFVHTQDIEEADLIIVNTCGFIQSAKEESLNTIIQLHSLAKEGAKVVVAGCLAQRYADELYNDLIEADAIFGNRDLDKISSLVKELFEKDERQKTLYPYPENAFDEFYQRNTLLNWPGSAYLKISEGCNHHCHYCAIPLIRGDLRSRPKELIIKEAKELIASGIKEINVIAQDLAAYGTDLFGKSTFCDLMKDLSNLEGDFKLRMLYIHPDAFPFEILTLMQENDKILHYFDLPMQHANNKVLKQMGRTGNPEVYLKLVNTIREALPDAVIRTTMMVGYLDEDAKAFNELVDFVQKAQFDWMGSFVYSREEGTPAYERRTEEEQQAIQVAANRRQKKLERIQQEITQNRLKNFVGKTYEVLIEEVFEDEDLAIGRIYSQAPEVDGQTVVMGKNLKAGQVYKCGIRKTAGIDLDAVVIDD